MSLSAQAQKAELLRKLHHGPKILVLPNVWDVVSARIVEGLGFPAIATTSAGVAATLGYPDGQRISRDEMLEVVARIAAAVRVPVTADFEAGYGTTVEDMADSARALVAAGVVGLNYEDVTGDDESTHVPLDLQVKKIKALREASTAAMGVPLVVNARTDVYLMPIGPEATRFERTVERLRAYRDAGADCVFAPAVKDAATIGKLVKALGCPLNILLMAGCPSIPELQALGVARASAGSGLLRAALGYTVRVAKELGGSGSLESMLDGAVPFADLMELLKKSATA